MPTGLDIPIRVGANGGAALSSGSDNDDKIVRLALGDDTNENAFQQDIGMGLGVIFDINDALTKAKVIAKLNTLFQRFELQKRYRLRSDSIRWSSEEGEQFLEFIYFSLESDDTREFKMPYRAPAASKVQ